MRSARLLRYRNLAICADERLRHCLQRFRFLPKEFSAWQSSQSHLAENRQLHHHACRLCTTKCCAARTRISFEERRELPGSYSSKKRLADLTICDHSSS